MHRNQTHRVRELGCCAALLNLATLLRTGHLGGKEKIPLTDPCNRLTKRATADRSIPERTAFAGRATGCAEVAQGSHATPDDLAVVRASGGRAFDDAVQLWANHAQRYLGSGSTEHRTGRCCLAAAFSTASEARMI